MKLTYHRADVRAAIFSPDGKLVFSGGDYGKIKVWSISERSQIAEFEGPPVWSLATSWKGEEVFAGCRDGNIYHWNIHKKKLVHTLKGHREEVRSVALSPEGNMLLSGSQDSTVRAWDAHSGRCLYTAEKHEGVITGVWIQWEGEEGYRAVTASEEDGVRIWRIKDNYPPICTPFLSRPADTQKAVSQASLIVDSKKNIRNLLEDSKLEQAKDMLLRARQTPGFENNDELIEFSYEIAGKIGRYGRFIGARKLKSIKDRVDLSDQLAVTSDGKFLVSDAHNTMVWDVTTRSYLHTIRGKPYQQFTPKSFILPPDGKTALLFNLPEDGDKNPNSQIGLWDLESGRTLRSFVHSGSVKDFQINQDGTKIFTLENIDESHSGVVHIWDSSSGDELVSIPCERKGFKLQISQNEKYALVTHESSDAGCAISLISVSEGRSLHVFKGLGEPITISPNSTQAMALRQKGLTIIDLLSYQEIDALEGFGDCPRSTMSAFTNDGRHILGPHGQDVGIWSTETGKLESVLKTPGWDIGITCLKLGCNDGWIFAAGDVDYQRGEIALWQIGSTQPVFIFKGLGMAFSIPLFDQDRYLIAPREDQYCMWQLDWEHEFPKLTDWDKRIQGYLDVFLGQIGGINTWREMLKSDPANAQKWFTNLMQELASRGFGWVREEGVKKRLDEMSSY